MSLTRLQQGCAVDGEFHRLGGSRLDPIKRSCFVHAMARRTGRFETLPEGMAAGVLQALEACRSVVVRDVLARTRPFSPTYRAGLDVLDAIDRLAEALTGRRDLFHIGGSAPTDARR